MKHLLIRPHVAVRLLTFVCLPLLSVLLTSPPVNGASLRRSAIVRAIQQARPSVVSIHGHKNSAEGARKVNGMGTGVVIDPRGYIITNFHVVENVREIKVTMDDGQLYIATLIAHDPITDLAIIKIPARRQLPLINIGTSKDLMTGEEVIAVGNAYGYEQTVTRGIVSAQHRTVQVNDDQKYFDLIQTDASINPGNSGGPLLNIDGEMIAINVAVRMGAQGIGFAIPVDKAMAVAAQLMSKERANVWHGVIPEGDASRPAAKGVTALRIQEGSPAAAAGIQPGDIITQIDDLTIERTLDMERALIGMRPGQETSVVLRRSGRSLPIRLTLASASHQTQQKSKPTVFDAAWQTFGVQLAEIPPGEFRSSSDQFKGGLRIVTVKASSPAAKQGVRSGDILVGLHKWETSSASDLAYILRQPTALSQATLKFYILRGDETLFGYLPTKRLR